jgi:hypothetical protein
MSMVIPAILSAVIFFGTLVLIFSEKINRSISTAAVGNGLAFLSDIDGILHCLDVKTGKPYWTFDLKSPVWGSPLLADGKVYLGDADGDLAVFRANSKMEKPSLIDMADSVYSTPVPANGVLYVMTRTQLFAITANKRVRQAKETPFNEKNHERLKQDS